MRQPVSRTFGQAVIACAAAVILAGCTASAPAPAVTVVSTVTAPPATVTVTAAPPVTIPATPAPAPATPAAPAAPAAEATFVMPNVVGMVLQDAQDKLQSMGSFLMDQTDARGLGRVQVLDSNWKVCKQDPAPGSTVPVSTLVTLASVKLAESC